jgi:hypothetical protein
MRKRIDELPSVSNDMQSSETLCNSLGLNYESPALTAELQPRRAFNVQFEGKLTRALLEISDCRLLIPDLGW